MANPREIISNRNISGLSMVLILSNLVMKKLDPVTAPENENARNP